MFHESIFPIKNDKFEHCVEEEEPIKYPCETCYEEHHADQTLDSIPVIGSAPNDYSYNDYNDSTDLQD